MDKLACQREWAISCGALRRNIRPGCCAFRKHSSKCAPPSSSGESAEGISGAGCFTHSRLLRMCGRGSRDGSRRMLMLCAKPAHRKVRDEWGTRQIGDADLLIVEKPARRCVLRKGRYCSHANQHQPSEDGRGRVWAIYPG